MYDESKFWWPSKLPKENKIRFKRINYSLLFMVFLRYNSNGDNMIRYYKTNDQNQTVEVKQMEPNCWIDMKNPTVEEMKKISKKTNIDLDLFTTVIDDEEVSRIEEHNDVKLIVVNYPYITEKDIKNKYNTLPLGIITNKDYLITISIRKSEFLNPFRNSSVKDFFVYKKTRFILQILYSISTNYLKNLRAINREINQKEKTLYHSTGNKELVNLLNLEKSLVYFITSLKGNDVVLEKLSRGNILNLYEEDKDLLEDAIIENKQGIEMANIYREILTSTTDTYATIISNNLNVIMKFLAGITIVFSIPTMIASFLGMNVPLGKVGSSDFSFLLLVVLSILLSILVAIILKKKNML